MSKRKQASWESFKEKISRKRSGKKVENVPGTPEVLTVQRLSADVQGKCQKYSRIGALTMVPFHGQEFSMANIKKACTTHFKVPMYMECDILAGERGPSYTDVSQIKEWKVLHVRFIERHCDEIANVDNECESSEPMLPSTDFDSAMSMQAVASRKPKVLVKSRMPASVPLSAMINLGKLIPPKPSKDLITLVVEEFSVENKKWLDPFEVRLAISKEKFASGGFRDAYDCTALSGLKGRYVLKKYQHDKVEDIVQLFGSLEIHTRKIVQMHCLARHFTLKLKNETPADFGASFLYNKVYYAQLDDQFITIEQYLDGDFQKYVNNTGEIIPHAGCDLALKAEMFAHYTYVKSQNRLMVLDIQGADYSLCDPEIASSQLVDDNDNILFCNGNLSSQAIDTFVSQHVCNKFCKMLHEK